MRRSAALTALLWALLWAPTALAYEDQLTLGVTGGWAVAPGIGDSHGAALDLALGVGLDPVWTLRLRGTYGLHPGIEPDSLHSALFGGELLYIVDVLEIVPYAGVGIAGQGRFAAGESTIDAGASLVLGADYLLTRELALELDLRGTVLLSALEDDPFYVTALVGVVFFFDD